MRTRRRPIADRMLLVAMAMTAFNLRPAVTSVGALLRQLQAGTGMSDALAGLLTSVPVIAFGATGVVASRLVRRMGVAYAFVLSLLLLAAGLSIRVLVLHPWIVLTGSAVALTGIGIANILLPVAIKRWFPDRVGWVTGLYSMSLALGTATAAAATVPIAALTGGWRSGMAIWVVPVVGALWCWSVVLATGCRGRGTQTTGPVPPASLVSVSVHRSRQAWALTVFFGVQSLAAYVMMGWLPTIYQDAGVSPTAAGLYLGIVMFVGAPISVGLPMLAARVPDQRAVVGVLVALTAVAYTGLLFLPARLPALWAVLLGTGFGAFPLALTLIGLRTSSAHGTTQLSSLTQGVGYLIAAAGPFAVGVIHEATGDWTWPLVALIALLIPQLVAGLAAAKPGYVDVSTDLQ